MLSYGSRRNKQKCKKKKKKKKDEAKVESMRERARERTSSALEATRAARGCAGEGENGAEGWFAERLILLVPLPVPAVPREAVWIDVKLLAVAVAMAVGAVFEAVEPVGLLAGKGGPVISAIVAAGNIAALSSGWEPFPTHAVLLPSASPALSRAGAGAAMRWALRAWPKRVMRHMAAMVPTGLPSKL